MNNLEELINMSRFISRYCVGFEGNTSCRTDDGLFIKASGKCLEHINKRDFVECDKDGNLKDGYNFKPSMESVFHSFLYEINPEIKFIAHTHPPKTVGILCTASAKAFAIERLFPDQVIFNGEISCYVPYATPGNKLKEEIQRCLKAFMTYGKGFPKLFVLQNHGIIVCGKTANECRIITDICEKAADVWNNGSHGHKIFLTKEEKSELLNDKQEQYRQTLV